ncbi:MAG: PilZ domain-containing protein [Planctomycetota bacterium]
MAPGDPRPHAPESRRAERVPLEAPVRMRFDVGAIDGLSDNISQIGLMFFTSDPLPVTVEIDEGGRKLVRHGRLMRVQRLNEASTGLAIEFDDLE